MGAKIDVKAVASLKENLKQSCIKEPLFMMLCPNAEKREAFMEKYFNYYLERWAKNGDLLYSASHKTAVTLIDPADFKYGFSGPHSYSLKLSSCSGNVLVHQEEVERITDVIIPNSMPRKILTIYGDPKANLNEIIALVEKCREKAVEEEFVLVYETLSKKLIPLFEQKEFETAYSKLFLDSQFWQTIMIYNILSKNQEKAQLQL